MWDHTIFICVVINSKTNKGMTNGRIPLRVLALHLIASRDYVSYLATTVVAGP